MRYGKGDLPNKVDMLTTDEVHLLFTHEAVGIHNPLAIYNAMILLCSILGRRLETNFVTLVLET